MTEQEHPQPVAGLRPWGVNVIGNLVGPPNVQTAHPELGYVRSVPAPYRKTWIEAIRAAWWVLTGKAEAVVWPMAGELEAALRGDA